MKYKSFEELKGERIFSVGELIEKLSNLDPSAKVVSSDTDCGGYDCSTKPYLVIQKCKSGVIRFGHNEFEAYCSIDKTITYDQYREIICDNRD